MRPVIAVLSTSFRGGTYFSQVLRGIADATAEVGGRLLAVQTCVAGAPALDLCGPPDFGLPLGWDLVDAVAVILNAATPEYLESVRAAGKPVVMVGDATPGFSCPVVLPDNRGGVTAAVGHLIAHGHERIAFAGSRLAPDVKERYEAYRACLEAHGLTPDPALVYDTGDSEVGGGEAAARAMVGAGLPSTAVVAGNDHTAIGLLRAFKDAGYRLPADQAIVGFDDLEPAAYLSPGLSTVRQDFARIGAFAAKLLLTQLSGEPVADGFHHVPTEFVARESCGCPSTLRLRAEDAPAGAVGSREQFDQQLTATIVAHSGRVREPGRLVEGADTVHRVLEAALHGTEAMTSQEMTRGLLGLYESCPDLETMIQVMRVARRYGEHLCATYLEVDDVPGMRRVDAALQEVNLALALAQTRADRADIDDRERSFTLQHDVGMGLLRSDHRDDPRHLQWLRRTSARAAALALWRPGAPGPALTLHGVFNAGERAWTPSARPLTLESFPPAELVDLADPATDDMLFVAPMAMDGGDLGLLAVVGAIESRRHYGREIVNHWAALLTSALEHRAVLESLRTQQDLLRRAAMYDELTGLPNRALLFDRLRCSIAEARRHRDRDFALCLLDLDGFKLVNDSLGHLAGDQLLVIVADRIRSCLRETDSAARLGGDEFAVLLDDLSDTTDVGRVLARLRDAVARPCLIAGQEIVVTASIGVALDGRAYERPEEVVRDADIAMYSAKTFEKGTHAVFDVKMHDRAVGRLRTEGELRRAVENDELVLYYQPIVDLASARTVAFEALIRWQHPGNGLVSPSQFLPVAEECGLTLPIGQWVITEGCRQFGEWRREFGDAFDLRLSVNIANRQFWHGRVVDDMAAALHSSGLGPNHIRAEITEGVIMHDVRQGRRTLDGLHDLGVDVHIDDFGTGYSSLEALNHLPIDALKIDRSFVAPLPEDRRSAELVRAIVAMGTSLGVKLVAEGIETAGQYDVLRELGCAFGQGFGFSRPLSPQAARKHLMAVGSPTVPRPRRRNASRSRTD